MTNLLFSLLAAAGQPGAAAPPPDVPVDAELEQALAADAQTTAKDAAQAPAPPSPPATTAMSLNPDIAVILDAALASFSREEPRQSGAHDPARSGFTLQQVELSLGKAVDPYFRFDAFLAFSQFGVEVEEAFATTTALPWNLQIRAGQLLTRFGRQNSTHPHSWEFLDQPFMLGRVFGGEGNRGVGAELSVLLPLPWYVEISLSMTEASGEATARSFWGAEDLGVHSPLDLQSTFALKQFFPLSDDLSLLWGLSAALGPNPTGYRNRTEVFGSDLFLKLRPITMETMHDTSLQLELLHRRRQVPSDVLVDTGGYAQLAHHWARRYAAAVRYEYGTPVWNEDGQVANDTLDPLWPGHRHRATAALSYFPTEFSRLRLQGSVDTTSIDETPVWAAMLGLEVSIGAHGAHAF
jgi:hypothetical protein